MKWLRWLLLPFAVLYYVITSFRNWLYDKNIFKSTSFDFPIISVGNLSVGGTGKTPHIEYLIRLLQNQYQIATLSRGYKRRTTGFLLANDTATAQTIGDEPMQLYQKFNESITVAVGESRVIAVPNILLERPKTEVILLDDAFQHRAIAAGLAILLTSYDNLFTQDYIMPIGRLRESRKGSQRANLIIVTKCPTSIETKEKEQIVQAIQPLSHQTVLFSYLQYKSIYNWQNPLETKELTKKMSALLVCGIARTATLENYLTSQLSTVDTLFFGDHHYFTEKDIQNIQERFQQLKGANKVLITTEKDAVRLAEFKDLIIEKSLPIYCLPIEVSFSEKDSIKLKHIISIFMSKYKTNIA